MSLSKWWKCDLQIATPAWDFNLNESGQYDFEKIKDREEFADSYMSKLKEAGVEIVALADHNTGEWIDIMKDKGEEHGIVVFPGLELSTGSGADGIHIIIIGKRNKTSTDFDRLIYSFGGFDERNPTFSESKQPLTSSKTIQQILDKLPEDYLVIAPHVFNDNGIASKKTAKGDIRWRALHHPKLMALDPGNCSNPSGNGFNDRFKRRELDDFPRLRDIAFVYTSDTYSFSDIGSKFTWIRMSNPSLEGLRQAFIDHESRIICGWEQNRLKKYLEENPNNYQRSWIKKLNIEGNIGNSESDINLEFHPGLNVIAGGRGSGKSTVVAALRNLYSSFRTLPNKIKEEAKEFSNSVFNNAVLSSEFIIANSQQNKLVKWNSEHGSKTLKEGDEYVDTSQKVRVINQKELFERVTKRKQDPFSASRSLIDYVDESLEKFNENYDVPGSWFRRLSEKKEDWISTIQELVDIETDIKEISRYEELVKELKGQLEAFDSPEAKNRRFLNEKRIKEKDDLNKKESTLREWLDNINTEIEGEQIFSFEKKELNISLNRFSRAELDFKSFTLRFAEQYFNTRNALEEIIKSNLNEIDVLVSEIKKSQWQIDVENSIDDQEKYEKELADKGINIDDYQNIKTKLDEYENIIDGLEKSENRLEEVSEKEKSLWNELIDIYIERFKERENLFTEISTKSGFLRFNLQNFSDNIEWVERIRKKLNTRSDAFLDDIPELSKWIWDQKNWQQNLKLWKKALKSGDMQAIDEQISLRSNFREKLENLELDERINLATIFAGDSVKMEFLQNEKLDKSDDKNWQDITDGSPGQRTAAMLSFVLNHGTEPLILDQPEDDLDTELITDLVVKQLRANRWYRQTIVITHNANIPVLGDAENIIILENKDNEIRIRFDNTEKKEKHQGALESRNVRQDIQNIMEGGIVAFIQREQKYNNEINDYSSRDNSN